MSEILVPKELMDKMFDHGKRDHPYECCGILIGDYDSNKVDMILETENMVTDRKHDRFIISPEDQLKGEQIPLAARIVAITDVFDALTSKRLYKERFSTEKSFEIIREGKGSQFDPDVVDAFFSAKREILAIKEKYKDKGESMLMKFYWDLMLEK